MVVGGSKINRAGSLLAHSSKIPGPGSNTPFLSIQKEQSFLILSLKEENRKASIVFLEESTIWQWLKAEGTKNESSARTTSL